VKTQIVFMLLSEQAGEATHVVRWGDLLPAGTKLVTSGWDLVCCWQM